MHSSQIWCSVLMMTATVADRRPSHVLWFVLSLWWLRLFLSISITFLWKRMKTKFFLPVACWGKFSTVFSPSLLTDDGVGRFLANEDFWEGWWSVLACSLATVESDSWCADRGVGSLFYTLRTWIYRRFRSLVYTSYSGICLVVSRVRCVCYTSLSSSIP